MADLDPNAADTGGGDTTTADTTTTTDTTLATGATTDTATTQTDGPDWRAQMAGDDPDALKFLGRYHSSAAAIKAWKDQNDAIKAGKYITPLPENPTDAEKATYLKQMGVPEKPEAYAEKLGDGFVIGDDDKPFFDKFFNDMHAVNAPPAMVTAAVQAYQAIVEDQAAAEEDMFAEASEACQVALREEWPGGEYKRNLNIINSFGTTLPDPVRELFFGREVGKNQFIQARMPDGTPVGSNPEVVKWLAAMALAENPLATVVPGAGANQADAIADEIAGIEKRMTTDRAAYYKDEKAQARYIQLLEAQEKLAGRGG
jgi:hypothetical protein